MIRSSSVTTTTVLGETQRGSGPEAGLDPCPRPERRRRAAWGRLAALGATFAIAATTGACLNFDPFGCQDHTQCDAEPMGRCEAVGYCSYPDLACPDTGYRYEQNAGDGLGGQCVGSDVAGTGSTGPTSGATDPDSDTSLDSGTATTTPDPTDSDDDSTTGEQCGAGGQACCPGDTCDAGLACNEGLCGCVDAVAVGDRHTCILRLDGSVSCWGANDLGQLASAPGEPPVSLVPVEVSLDSGATTLAARNHTCAVLDDASLFCWGDNAGQKASAVDPSPTIVIPTEAIGAAPAETVGVGGTHTCVGRSMGQAPSCWGANGSGQLTAGAAPGPLSVPGGFQPFQIELGDAHTCMSTLMGELYCWGDNAFGQIGADPVMLPTLDVPQLVAVPQIGALATGSQHTCVTVGSDVQCWGRNDIGQLGNDTTTDGFAPTTALFPAGAGLVNGLVAAADHTCAVMASGELYCWGGNQEGELFLDQDEMGEDGFALTPRAIELDFAVQQLTTGTLHSCALSTTGQVFCWGDNDYGQLGEGTTDNVIGPTPAQITCP